MLVVVAPAVVLCVVVVAVVRPVSVAGRRWSDRFRVICIKSVPAAIAIECARRIGATLGSDTALHAEARAQLGGAAVLDRAARCSGIHFAVFKHC